MYKKLIVNLALLFTMQAYGGGHDLQDPVISTVYQSLDESRHSQKSSFQPWFSKYLSPPVKNGKLGIIDWFLHSISRVKDPLIKASLKINGLAEDSPNLFLEESLSSLNQSIPPITVGDLDAVYESDDYDADIEEQYLESLSNPQAKGVDFIHQLYSSGVLSPSQALKRFYDWLENDERVQHLQHLLIKKNKELAFEQARQSDSRWQECIGSYEGDYKRCIKKGILKRFDGIIIAVKDEICVKGYTTTDGLTDEVYQVTKGLNTGRQSRIVTYLLEAGVVIAGKANQKPFGLGATGHNSLFLELSNPYSGKHDTAGSSSGSGVFAVIGGVFAVATDAGGSIGMPAAISGAQGIKPTEGKITTEGYDNPAEGLTSIGFIANNYQDLARAYLEGSKKYPTAEVLQVLGKVKIGIDPHWFQHCSKSVCSLTLECLDRLATVMTKVGNSEPVLKMKYLPDGYEQDLWNTHAALFVHYEAAEKKAFMNNWGVPAEIRLSLEMGAMLPEGVIQRAQGNQKFLKNHFHTNIFSRVHVIAMPTTLITAPERIKSHQGELDLPKAYLLSAHTSLANLTGDPRVTIMCGYDEEGLPIGLQLMADHDGELLLLRLGAELEKLLAEELEGYSAWKYRPYFDISASEDDE